MRISWEILMSFEYDKVLDLLAEFCVCSATKERARALLPLSAAELPTYLEIVRELQELLRFDGDIPFGEFPDIRPAMRLLGMFGSCLSLEEARKVHRFLLMCHDIRCFVEERKLAGKYPFLASSCFRNILNPAELLNRLAKVFGKDGGILDTASDRLWNIRKRKEEVKAKIEDILHRMLQDARVVRYLQEPLYTVRRGRYVLPVKAQFRGMVRGFVVDSSASGSTLFVEPWSVAELSRELEALVVLEEEEIARILSFVTEWLRPLRMQLEETFASLVELDLVRAKVKLGEKWKGNLPRVGGDILSIRGGRHPLLGERAVPFDLEIQKDRNLVLVSGPNGGGKTVLVKALALLVVLTFCGIPAPLSQDSFVPLYEHLFVDVGDHQDLGNSLSTFTSRMVFLRDALKEAGPSSLFLIDELGAGTDPGEGAALGMAILEYLGKRGVTCVATTHLPALREYALRNPRVLPASLSFDPKTLQPTYRLVVGCVEGSYGITIAERIGIPKEIVEDALSFLRKEEVELNELLVALSREKVRLEEVRRSLEEELAKVLQEREEMKLLRKTLEAERRHLRKTLREELATYLKEKEKEIARLVGELRKAQKLDTGVYQELRTVLAEGQKRLASLQDEPEPVEEFREGDVVFVDPLGHGVILAVDAKKREILVAVGDRKVRVAPDRLRRSNGLPPQSTPSVRTFPFFPKERISNEVVIRALRAEEALLVLEKYLDRAILAGFKTVYIIHGKGEGKLRQVTHEFLRNHPQVEDFRLGRPEEGGLGVTVVTLRG
ncbi:endonuclease MutS2 [Candidatus Caldatribacterium sp.]|uniref:endonuclease MutS2 n=1 Tax=Candidatus Caldatribacterium sp. TaxID=2282143 RepID=UPI00384A30AE|nr:Smr/MutS family protein [Candidatus Caldatribacterium sp.]